MMPSPLTMQEVRRIRELRYGDGLTIQEVKAITGHCGATVSKFAPGRIGKVPNDKLRAAFLTSGKTASEVARQLGWWSSVYPDVSRVRRTLGLNRDINGHGKQTTRTLIDAETAGLIAEAIGVMPWEVMPDEDEEAA